MIFNKEKINVNLSNFNDRKKINAFLSYWCENWLIISTISQANISSSHLSKFMCKIKFSLSIKFNNLVNVKKIKQIDRKTSKLHFFWKHTLMTIYRSKFYAFLTSKCFLKHTLLLSLILKGYLLIFSLFSSNCFKNTLRLFTLVFFG